LDHCPEDPGHLKFAYVTPDGAEARRGLADAWAVPLEAAPPVRRFVSYKGQKHLPGDWWSATGGCLIGFESWLERDHLMLLDFDPAVVGIASQPFWLFWTTEEGKARSHAPDYFARRRDGSGVVVDCRPLERRKPRDLVAFEVTRQACEAVGWDYRLVDAPDRVLVRNVRWLSGYRHPRHFQEVVAAGLLDAFADPAPLLTGARDVGDPIMVLPTLFHLLWSQELVVDLSAPLHQSVTVSLPGVA
jgi:hypothetical protein